MHPITGHPARSVEDYLAVEDGELMSLLHVHGQRIDTLEPSCHELANVDIDEAEVVPLRKGWLWINVDDSGQLIGKWVDDPVNLTGESKPLAFPDSTIAELAGWSAHNLDVDASIGHWLRVYRHPHSERFAVTVYTGDEPEPTLVLIGTYPDAHLCEGTVPKVVYVEPHPETADKARARIMPINAASTDWQAITLVEGPAGGVKVLPCSVRRFVKVGHGVRSARQWKIADTDSPDPHLLSIPGFVHDPDLFDVGYLNDEPVLIHATNNRHHWHIDAYEIGHNRIHHGWRVANGEGEVRQLTAGSDRVLVRVNLSSPESETEHLHLITLDGFSALPAGPLLKTEGQFDLSLNTCATAVGFAAVEMSTGTPPMSWYLDPTGHVLNPLTEHRAGTRAARDRFTSPDGYECTIDMRWRGGPQFQGPVVFMVYGAYGLDLELDTDPELRYWLDRGYAVATAHVRGGGDLERHQAGARHMRENSLIDTVTAAQWLRSGNGSVTATQLCVIGASAGGFLAASLLTEAPGLIDAGVIVNGYVDPLQALLRLSSLTGQADLDEWGDPINDSRDFTVLHRLSPLRKLSSSTPPTLVIVAGRDVRVDPRLGLAWLMRVREMGNDAALWFDPDGTHDRWGTELNPSILIDWVDHALDRQ